MVFKLYVLSLDDDFELDSDDHQKIYSFILYLLNNDYRPRNEDDVSLIKRRCSPETILSKLKYKKLRTGIRRF
jgi:hypothetical protein